MNRDATLVFKASAINAIIDEHIKLTALIKTGGDALKRESKQSIGEGIIGGYWYSLLYDVMVKMLPQSSWIDFTYDSIHNLPQCLTALYVLQKKSGYTADRNAEVMAKTIASVLYGLAINEHNCVLRVKNSISEITWGPALSIQTGMRHDVDFLSSALSAVRSPFRIEDGLMIDMTEPINKYYYAMKVDLSEYGVANMILHD